MNAFFYADFHRRMGRRAQDATDAKCYERI